MTVPSCPPLAVTSITLWVGMPEGTSLSPLYLPAESLGITK